ncbi:hypothetical protein P8935_06100 [Telmatobacter sp. DSM 110680]|uniref:Alpha-L-arabinofuranosidase n=1 Tax=Telmatobacter sp. DSM 110680 TaxID=3036704 RepID=A0AAU7DNJ4_9BACT
MKNLHQNAALWMAVSLAATLTACGGGGGGSTTPPPPPAKTTPTITVTPSASTITTAQALSVAVAVNGGSGNAVPTGSITLSSGAYTSSATTLASGSATVNVAAGSLAVGANTLTASYTPDSSSSSTYNAATGKSSAVNVTAIATTVAVNQASIGPAISDKLLGMNMAAWYDPTTAAVVPAFQAAGIKAVRWPGGSWSDDYHWATNTMCGNTPNTNATFANFVNDLVTPGSFDVALTANYGTNAACTGPGDPTEAAAWIAQAKSINAHVSHMTVGNEEYGSWEDDLHSKKNDAATYAAAVGTASTSGYYSLIKAADSSVLVGVDVNPGNSPAWDPTVLANSKYDFVEYHYYPQAPGSESDTYLVQKAANDLTTEINTLKTELATAGNPNTPIYVGEIGSVYSNPGKQSLSITQGLYAGQVLGELMNDGVARATWWIGFGNCNGTQGNDSSSLYGWQNFGGYNVFADGPSDTGCAGAGPIGTMSPTARAFQLFSKVAVNGESVLTATVAGDTANVRAYAATNSGGTALVLFNLNQSVSAPVTVSLSAQTTSSDVLVETYSKALYDQSQNNVWAAPTTTDLGTKTLPLALTLDPWSMNVVIIK